MGELRKKANGWRLSILGVLAAFSCLMMSFGAALLNWQNPGLHKLFAADDVETNDTVLYWGERIRSDGFSSSSGKTYYINAPEQLAFMSYIMAEAAANGDDRYSGCTFILENDIDLGTVELGHKTESQTVVHPLWVPINLGKNHNITFNGNGKTISGMTIKYDDATPRNLGLFSEMVGGVFENVVFENPVIEYTYRGESIAATNALRPDAPIEIGVGVIAGAANGTYIKDVEIINPQVKFTANNLNAHNFYVGTAVGKLSYSASLVDGKATPINTVTPTKWGLDTVKVETKNNGTAELTMKVNAGFNANFGSATNGYLGGLVGANISSKILNSTLHSLAIKPEFTANLAGTYYVGGMVGLTTQIATDEKLLVAAGLYNNVLVNVSIENFTAQKSYAGKLAGRVVAGGWLYNNIVIGNNWPTKLWGEVSNSNIYLINNPEDGECIANILGGVDRYYLDRKYDTDTYSNCSYAETKVSNENNQTETFVICQTHQNNQHTLFGRDTLLNGEVDKTATEGEMQKYNHTFTSVSDFNNNFVNKDSDVGDDTGNKYTKFSLLNVFTEGGYMYYASLPIVKYELGLTVNIKNPETGNDATDEEKVMDAAYQFRTWDTNTQSEPYLAGYHAENDYSILFKVKADDDKSGAEPYWERLNEFEYMEKYYELKVKRTYLQVINKPETPKCDGYELVGWRIEGLEDNSPKMQEMIDKNYFVQKKYGDSQIYVYDFDNPNAKERISEPGRCYYAVWAIQKFTVHYMLDKETPYRIEGENKDCIEEKFYGYTIDGLLESQNPKPSRGRIFVGWFKTYYGDDDADLSQRFVFGSSDPEYRMPGEDLFLYAGWKNNFTLLEDLIEEYAKYFEQDAAGNLIKKDGELILLPYFNDELGSDFHAAYSAALKAYDQSDNTNANELLENLQSAINGLRVDPQKLLDLPAFNDELDENAYPFLYDYQTYMKYRATKNDILNYVQGADTYNIAGFIMYYNNIVELYNGLKNNLHASVAEVGGIKSAEVQDLITKYNKLKERNDKLDKTKYDETTLAKLDAAEEILNKLWAGESSSESDGPHIRDVEMAVDAYEKALNNLKLKGATSTVGGTGTTSNKPNSGAPKLPIDPMLLGILGVVILVVIVGGYIGIDMMLINKRRVAGKTKATKTNTKNADTNQVKRATPVVEDDDTYI